MPENPQETENFGFPLMSESSLDEYRGVWGEVIDNGGPTDNDGLIEAIDEYLYEVYKHFDGDDLNISGDMTVGDNTIYSSASGSDSGFTPQDGIHYTQFDDYATIYCYDDDGNEGWRFRDPDNSGDHFRVENDGSPAYLRNGIEIGGHVETETATINASSTTGGLVWDGQEGYEMRGGWNNANDRFILAPGIDGSAQFDNEFTYYFDGEYWQFDTPVRADSGSMGFDWGDQNSIEIDGASEGGTFHFHVEEQ